jgi:hypothetical protein
MPSRYTRDELIRIAISMAQVPNLEHHDIPNGVVQVDAFAIQWLQDILDFWYHMVPFSSTVTKTSVPVLAQTNDIPLPDDFILDVRNGYIVQATSETTSKRRTHRVPLQTWINRDLYYQSTTNPSHNTCPGFYMIQDGMLKVTPQSSVARSAELWYYALPPILESHQKPTFPNDYVITEYIRIRALEWCRAIEPGIAQKFCDKIMASMKANGLLNEPEDDAIPFDDLTYRHHGTGQTAFSWMGPT